MYNQFQGGHSWIRLSPLLRHVDNTADTVPGLEIMLSYHQTDGGE